MREREKRESEREREKREREWERERKREREIRKGSIIANLYLSLMWPGSLLLDVA